MKRKTFIVYYVLTFLLLGLIPLGAILFNNGSMDFDQAALRATEKTGYVWTSNLIVVFRLILSEPILIFLVLGSAVPALAALVALIFKDGKGKWRRFWGRLHPFRNINLVKGLKLYAEIFVLLILGLFVTFYVRQWTGGNYEWSDNTIGLHLIPSILIIAFLDQGAIFEELGWRGFATPELQERGMNPLKVAILIGICWGLWHLPRDITTGVIERLGLFSYLLLYLPSFLLGTIAVSVIASFYMNKMGGSVIPAIVIHGITNDSIGLSGQASIIEALTPYHQITKAMPFAIIALILLWISGSMLNWQHNDSSDFDKKPYID